MSDEAKVMVRWNSKIEDWRADDAANSGKDPRAVPGGTVTWLARGTDATITFPTNEVFLQQQLFVNDQQDGTLTVKTSAPTGSHDYTVYCHGGGGNPAGNAQGGEGPHPVIIVTLSGQHEPEEPEPK
jgi:hypothetical protein